MKRYAKYKDSGISWIGEVPEHWSKYPIFTIFRLKSKCGFCDEELLSVYLDKGVVKFSDVVEKRTNATSEDLSKYQLVEPGDFVLNNQQAWRGSVGVSKYRGIISPAYVILDMSDELNWNFANSLLRDRSMVAMYYIASKGVGSIQRNLVWNKFKRMLVFIPPLFEQKVIADFLDKKTAQINELVAAKKKQIELLKEYKQAVIAKAVTQGINPKAKMKDSGITWIGQIPEHWNIKRIASLFVENKQVNKDFAYKKAFQFKYGNLVPKNEIGNDEEYRETYVKYTVLNQNDIVFNGLNLNYDFVSQRVAISPESGIITSAYIAITPRNKVNAFFYSLLFKTMDNKKMLHGMGSGIRLTLSFCDLKSQLIPIPPLSEQEQIVAYIKEKVDSIDAQIASVEKQIANLNEFKQSLISDAVTGKIKVA